MAETGTSPRDHASPLAEPTAPGPDSPGLTVGVLICDHLDPEVVALHPDYPQRYRSVLAPPDTSSPADAGADPALEPVMFDLTAGELPDQPERCDAWLIGGSRLDAHSDEGFVPELVDFAAECHTAGVPLVGICFGHQIVARALGGTVERADGWGAGVRSFEVAAQAPWMLHPPESVSMVVSHRDQVTRLPTGAELLLRAGYCPIAGFRVGDSVFCIQGHPEFDTELSRTLCSRRRRAMGDEVTDEALASLAEPSDGDLVNGWIRRFLLASRT